MKTKEILKRNLLHNITGNLFRTFLAEEPTPAVSSNTTEPVGGEQASNVEAQPKAQENTINYEQLIAQARTEEKNRLYPQINNLKAQIAELTKKNNDLLLSVGTKDQEIQEIKAQKTPASENKEIAELKTKVAELEKQLGVKEAEIGTIKLNHFKEAKIAELNGEVIPELIYGNNEEEILASIELSKTRYAEILGKVQDKSKVGGQATSNVGTVPPANPDMSAVFTQQVESLDISSLNLFNPADRAKYEAFRQQAGLR